MYSREGLQGCAQEDAGSPGLALDVWVMSGHMDMQIAAPTEYASEAETHES